jgi:NADH-quinone oxidoreductase E subunit
MVIERARDRYPLARSAILPALWAVQQERGLITPDAMSEVAAILQVTPSEVEAVSTFYSMYFQHPHGRHEVIVCINVSCALRGAEDIVDHLERSLGCASGETTADGAFTWSSTVECLGGCGGAPTMQVDHHFQENLTPDRVDEIIGALRSAPTDGEAGPVAAGPLAAARPGLLSESALLEGDASSEPGRAAAQPPATPPATPSASTTRPAAEAPPDQALAEQTASGTKKRPQRRRKAAQ